MLLTGIYVQTFRRVTVVSNRHHWSLPASWVWGPTMPQYCAVLSPKSCPWRKYGIVCGVSCFTALLQKNHRFSVSGHVFKNGIGMCDISVWIYSPRNKIFPVISVALIAHHAPILSCNETSFNNNMGFHAGQYLVFWEFTNPLSWTQASSLSRTNVGSVSPICTPCWYPFTKFTLAVRCVLLGVWTIVVICGCKFSSFISCPALDADTSVCCAGQTDNFLGDRPL
jgi:hypothetical protein